MFQTWGSAGDSVGDTGRLLSLYVRLLDLGRVSAHRNARASFQATYQPKAVALANHALALIKQQQSVPPPAGCKGLLQGAPEHDWSGTTNLYFYSNNVWIARGLQEFAGVVQTTNASYSALLMHAGDTLLDAVTASVQATAVNGSGSTPFVPPYATTAAMPFSNMTESRLASYSNFRFFPEALLADALPRWVESAWLTYHNSRGGRIGGASRWSSHLDDMPVAGWGYAGTSRLLPLPLPPLLPLLCVCCLPRCPTPNCCCVSSTALTNNRTADFLALLYGHMATYASRGSFHATEQLSFLGENHYRGFLHWDDPLPPATVGAAPSPTVSSGTPANLGTYYAQEQDVSYCIITAVLAARLSAWQLVFEDSYRSMATSGRTTVWLARGAPLRWFRQPPSGGFAVDNMPLRTGLVSYTTNTAAGNATDFAVSLTSTVAGVHHPVFAVRFPGTVSLPSVATSGCTVQRVDTDTGVVAVNVDATGDTTFSVHATWA